MVIRLHDKRYSFAFGIVCSIFAIYSIAWSYIALLRFYSLHALIYDLGAAMESMWQLYHPSLSFGKIYYYLIIDGIRILISPISFLNSYPILLVLQTLFIGGSSILIFKISMAKNNNLPFSLAIAGIYLLYPPLAGLNWYDFHFQAFFPFLFLSGYYFYQKGHLVFSALFFLLSGLVRYPFSIFPMLFSIVELIFYFNDVLNVNSYRNHRKLFFLGFIFGILTLITVLGFQISGGVNSTLDATHINTNYSFLTTLLSNSWDKFLTIILLLLPLLFLPIFSPRWYVFYMPYLFLLLFSGNIIYSYPTLFRLQYGSLIIPFLFLGSIDGYHNLKSKKIRFKKIKDFRKSSNHLNRHTPKELKVPAIMVSIAIIGAAFFMPYGPLHEFSNDGMNLNQEKVNMTIFKELENLQNLIPKNASNVILQNNLPEGLPRPLISGDQIFVPGTNVLYNLSAQYPNGTWFKLQPDYILDDPFYGNYGQFYSTSIFPYNESMYNFVHYFESKGYGVIGEASGMILLKKDYKGLLKYYIPFIHDFKVSEFTPLGQSKINNNKIVMKNISNSGNSSSLTYYGPDATLSPGLYNISFSLASSLILPNNTFDLVVRGGSGRVKFAQVSINGTSFIAPNEVHKFIITAYLNNTYTNMEFLIQNLHWRGFLNLTNIEVRQMGPPLN